MQGMIAAGERKRVLKFTGLCRQGFEFFREVPVCESNAFLRKGDEEQLLLEEVAVIEPIAGGYRLRSLFGEETTVQGVIDEINLIKHKVVFKEN